MRRALSRLADTVVTGVQRDSESSARALARLSELSAFLTTLPPSSAHVRSTSEMVSARLASPRAPLLEDEAADASCEMLLGILDDEVALLRDTFSCA